MDLSDIKPERARSWECLGFDQTFDDEDDSHEYHPDCDERRIDGAVEGNYLFALVRGRDAGFDEIESQLIKGAYEIDVYDSGMVCVLFDRKAADFELDPYDVAPYVGYSFCDYVPHGHEWWITYPENKFDVDWEELKSREFAEIDVSAIAEKYGCEVEDVEYCMSCVFYYDVDRAAWGPFFGPWFLSNVRGDGMGSYDRLSNCCISEQGRSELEVVEKSLEKFSASHHKTYNQFHLHGN